MALQAGDPETLRLWRTLIDDSKQYYNAIYSRLGVTLTDADLAPESFYNPLLEDVCRDLEQAGIAVISDGALCAFPPGFTGRDGSPLPLILRKSDGGYGYGTTDMAAIRYRVRDLAADRIIYVVGSEQAQHFAMVFAVARQAGWLPDSVVAEHAAIGMVTGTDRKRFRSRSGESVKLIDLIDEAVSRAEEVIKDRYDDPELRAQIAQRGRDRRAEVRGPVGRQGFELRARLRPDAGADRQHRTVPAVRDGADQVDLPPGWPAAGRRRPGRSSLSAPAERALALRLLGFGAAVAESAATAEPHKLAGFVFDLASDFTTFYEQCPVLKAEQPGTQELHGWRWPR